MVQAAQRMLLKAVLCVRITDVDTVLSWILVSEVDGAHPAEGLLSRKVASQKNLLWRSGVLIKMLKQRQ